MKDALAELGLNLKTLVSGFAGGVVSAFLMRNIKAVEAVSSVIVGTLTAAFLADHAVRYLGVTEGAAGFLVGLTAMVVCQRIIDAARKWAPPSFGGRNEH